MYRKYCKTFPKCAWGENQFHPIEVFPRHFQIVSEPKFNCILLKLFYDVFELSPSPNSFVSYQNCCKAFPKYVKRNSIATHWNSSMTFSSYVSSKVRLTPVEFIPRHFQIVFLTETQLHPIDIFPRHFSSVS